MSTLETYIKRHGKATTLAALGVKSVTLWRWLKGKSSPPRTRAESIEAATNGEIKAEDLLLLGLRRKSQ